MLLDHAIGEHWQALQASTDEAAISLVAKLQSGEVAYTRVGEQQIERLLALVRLQHPNHLLLGTAGGASSWKHRVRATPRVF